MRKTPKEKTFAENKKLGRGCPVCGDGRGEYVLNCLTCGHENAELVSPAKPNYDREERYLSIIACGRV